MLAVAPELLERLGRTHDPMPHLPPPDLAAKQAEWLSGARARLLRRAGIAHRRRVLDLGCGWGHVTEELRRRCEGPVVSLDWETAALAATRTHVPDALPVRADGRMLPFRSASLDLVFSQNALLWMGRPVCQAVCEIDRVLAPEGVLAAVEPDFGGMMEHPQEIATQELWMSGLILARADPWTGRHLPAWLEQLGFSVSVELMPVVSPPRSERFDLLAGLPLTAKQRKQLAEIRALAEQTPHQFVHLPYFLILATKGPAT